MIAHQTSATTSATPATPAQTRRRKTHLACSVCRDRKTRCDGRQPVCLACQRRGTPYECVYDESALKTQRYVTTLESRVRDLETSNTRLLAQIGEVAPSQLVAGTNASNSTLTSDTSHSKIVVRSTQSHDAAFDSRTRLAPTSQPLCTEHDTPSSTDGLATMTAHHADRSALFGGSSTIAFVRSISDTVGLGRSQFSTQALSKPEPRVPILTQSPTVDIAAVVLPSRHTADNFSNTFFEIVHPLFPIIHRHSFESRYPLLWEPTTSDKHLGQRTPFHEPIFLSIMNVVFALGCLFSDIVEPSRRTRLASEFYDRSVSLSATQVLDAASLESVQLLLLTGVYLQSTQFASRCWNTVGLAIRAAQALGLHLESKYLECNNTLQREMMRRVWYNCVILDTLQAMTFGRPTMISHPSNIRPPALIDDEYLYEGMENAQPNTEKSRMGFFVHSIKLFDILNEILSRLYLNEAERESHKLSSQYLSNVMRLNSKLDKFLAGLPDYLQPRHIYDELGSPKSACFQLQSNVLYCRFLYTRTLLLRPILLSAGTDLQHSNDNIGEISLEEHMIIKACTICSTAAQALIDSLYDNLHSVFRCSGWYTVYFTFAAATVLLGIRQFDILGTFSPENFKSSWNRVITILRYHEAQIQSAHRGVEILESLLHRIEEGKIRTDTSPQLRDASAFHAMPNFCDEDFDNLSTAWFTEQITNLDYLDILTGS